MKSMSNNFMISFLVCTCNLKYCFIYSWWKGNHGVVVVAHNTRCVLSTSLWMDTILETKYSSKPCLLSVLHKNEVRKLRERQHRQLSVTSVYLMNFVLFWFVLLNFSWNTDWIQPLTCEILQLKGWRNC